MSSRDGIALIPVLVAGTSGMILASGASGPEQPLVYELTNCVQCCVLAAWSSGMSLVSGARGPGFNPRAALGLRGCGGRGRGTQYFNYNL